MTNRRYRSSLTIILTGFLFIGQVSADSATRQYHIPAQPLNSALMRFASDSNLELLYTADKLRAFKTVGLDGSMTAAQALSQLLQGSGMTYRFVDANTVTIVPPSSNFIKTAGTGQDTEPQTGGEGQVMPKVTVEADAEADPYDPNDTTHPYNKSYVVSNVTTATKTDTPIFDTPVSVQTIPKSVMRDQQAIRVGDALRNVSGYFDTRGEEFFYDTAFLRGFDTGSSQYIDGLRDVSMSHSLAMSERIDVLKGPAGALYGRLEPGGLINYVTKRPLDIPFYSVQQQFGSFNKYRTLVDLTGPITQDKSLLYRINMEYLNSDSFMDVVHQERAFLAPSLTWRISAQTQLDLDFRYHNVNGQSSFGHPAVGLRPANIPVSRYIGDPSLDVGDWNLLYGGLSLSHAFNDNWKLDAKVGYNHNRQFSQGVSINPVDNNDDGIPDYEQTGNIDSLNFGSYDYLMDSIQGLINVTGKFNTWGAEHTLAVGGDIYKTDMKTYYYQYATADISPPINIYRPIVYGQRHFNVNTDPTSSGTDSWWGVYIQDQVTLFKDWQLMFGTRYDQARTTWDGYPTTDDGEFSPRVGLLYHPLPWLAVYGNYSKALNAANSVTVRPGTARKPQMSEGFEAGLKGNWLDGKLAANLTFYELTKSNVAQPDPNNQNYNIFIGKGRSKGIEFDISGQITDYLSIIGTYSYTSTKVLEDANFSGKEFYNVPKHAGSLWAKCDFDGFGVPGFWTGAGVYLAGERQGDGANSFQMPGYARMDLGLGYTLKTGPSKVSLQFNVDNLLDKVYYTNSTWASRTGGIQPAAPRTFIGSVRVDF
jgi:iron complex outermembrane recepter protein